MNEETEKLNQHRVSTAEIEIVNEMAVEIIQAKDKWFEEIAKRILEGLKSKNTERDDT